MIYMNINRCNPDTLHTIVYLTVHHTYISIITMILCNDASAANTTTSIATYDHHRHNF